MNDTPTPTPRTDERKASFALDTIRQLETKLAAVTEQRDGLRSGIDYASDQLTRVTEQRDRLAEALKPISETSLLGADDLTVSYIFKSLQHNADEALQSLKQPTEL